MSMDMDMVMNVGVGVVSPSYPQQLVVGGNRVHGWWVAGGGVGGRSIDGVHSMPSCFALCKENRDRACKEHGQLGQLGHRQKGYWQGGQIRRINLPRDRYEGSGGEGVLIMQGSYLRDEGLGIKGGSLQHARQGRGGVSSSDW
jgi:hypothetical protein